MVDIISKISDVASKTMEKLSAASSSIKEKVNELDKPLTEDIDESYDENATNVGNIDELDKPLSSEVSEYDEDGFRALTEDEKQFLRDNTSWPDKAEGIQGCKINEHGVIKYPCRRDDLVGKPHPETGIVYEKRIIDVNGIKVEVVQPKFDSVFDAQLPEDMINGTDPQQFKECNQQLLDRIKSDPEFTKQFTDEQIEQIEKGTTNGNIGAPDGYVWHHDAETGKMQLVDSDIHGDTRHTGGKVFWGGGNENRR